MTGRLDSADPAELAGGRYRLRAPLGSGGGGDVFEAEDRDSGAVVALKVLRGLSPERESGFKREFRALADVAHPNLVSLYELHTSGDEWFLTMELVVGASFIEWVRPGATTARPEEPTTTISTRDAPAPVPADPTLPTLSGALQPAPGTGARARVIDARLDLARLDAALYQLCDTVHALHQAGKLHRDL